MLVRRCAVAKLDATWIHEVTTFFGADFVFWIIKKWHGASRSQVRTRAGKEPSKVRKGLQRGSEDRLEREGG